MEKVFIFMFHNIMFSNYYSEPFDCKDGEISLIKHMHS